MLFKRLAKDTAVYGLSDIIGKLVTFISFPIISTVLSVSDFGTLDLILTSAALVGIFIGCGLSNAISRYYWDENTLPEDRPMIVSTGLLLQFIFGILSLLIALISIPYIYTALEINQDLSFGALTLVFVAILAPVAQWIQYIRDVIRLHLSPWKFTFISVFVKLSAAVLGVIAVVFLKAGIDGFVFAQVCTLIVALPLAIWFIKKDLTFTFSYKWAKALLQYGVPFIYVGMAYWIFGSIDRWMLASLSSIEETGIYSISARFSSLVLFASIAFGQAWSPNAIKIKTENPNNYRKIYATIFLVLLYLMLLIGGSISLFSKEIIEIMLPNAYSAATLPTAILCFGIIIQSTQQITAVGISLEKKTKIFGYMAWATAFLNIALNFIFISPFGAQGAAVATFFSYVFLTCGYSYFTQRLHPLPFSFPKILWLVFLGGCLAFLVYKFSFLQLSWNLVIVKLITLTSVAFLGIFIFKQEILESKKYFPYWRKG